MKKSSKTLLVFALLLFLLGTSLAFSSQGGVVPKTPLAQGISPVARFGQHIGRLDGSTPIQLAVILHLQNEAGLNALIAMQNDPRSPYYRHFLTPEQFAVSFSPSPAAYNAVVSYFQGSGFQVETSPNRQIILVNGRADQVEKALGTELHTYYYSGKVEYGNAHPAYLPSTLGSFVKAVQGLDSRELHPMFQENPRTSPGGNTTPAGFSPNQIAKAYDYPKLYGYNGAGRKLAVATAYNFKDTDIRTFDSTFGITIAGYQRVWVSGSTSRTNVETTLDVEESTALANGAFEYVYSSPNSSFSNFTAVYNKIVTDNLADAVTSSWGYCESGTGTSVMNQDNGIFAQGAAQGQSWFFAAGDSGAYDCNSTLSVDYPSSTPYATAASGTTLTLSNTGSIASESAWSGSGGGYSSYEARPSWEFGSSLFNAWRATGDFSMDADPNTGMAVLANGRWAVYGGTSFVAPFGSALAASIGQYKNGRLGIFAARINSLANTSAYSTVLHDITSGNNGYYNAGPGWDAPTGWGSPDGYMLMNNW